MARLVSSARSVTELNRPCSAKVVKSRRYLLVLAGVPASGFFAFCARVVSVAMMPATIDIAKPRAISHRHPGLVRTLLCLFIVAPQEFGGTRRCSRRVLEQRLCQQEMVVFGPVFEAFEGWSIGQDITLNPFGQSD